MEEKKPRVVIFPKEYIDSFNNQTIKILIVSFVEEFKTIEPGEILNLSTEDRKHSINVDVISICIYKNKHYASREFSKNITYIQHIGKLKIFDDNSPIVALKLMLVDSLKG